MVTPAAKREAVAYLCSAFEVSERRACSVLGMDRSVIRYRSTRPDDAAIRTRLLELASQRRRFGYRRLHILLSREGLARAPRPVPLLRRAHKAQINPGLYSSLSERRGSGHNENPFIPQRKGFATFSMGQLQESARPFRNESNYGEAPAFHAFTLNHCSPWPER
jgi:hypothetical protein